MGSVTLASNVPGAHATGHGTQAHLIYATNSGRWWLFYLSGSNVLSTAYSSDFVTWTAGGTLTLAHVHSSEGYNLSVAYANIASTDVVHIAVSYESTNGSAGHIRATISGTTISFAAEFRLGTALGSGSIDGPAIALDAGNFVYQGTGFISSINTDFGETSWANADTTGASWTPGTETDTHITTVGGAVHSHAVFGLASGQALGLADNSTINNILWSKLSGGSWSPTSSNTVLASNLTGTENGWGACKVSNTDIHVVYQSSTNVFTHRRWNGTSWSNGDTIPALTFKSSAGVALVSDGTSVWMFCVASASGNAIQYLKWTSGVGWDAAWSTLESTSQTRANVSVCPQIQGGAISVIWTEGSSTFNIVGEQLQISSTLTGAATGQYTTADGVLSDGAVSAQYTTVDSASPATIVPVNATGQDTTADAVLSNGEVGGQSTTADAVLSNGEISAAYTTADSVTAQVSGGGQVVGAAMGQYPYAGTELAGSSASGQTATADTLAPLVLVTMAISGQYILAGAVLSGTMIRALAIYTGALAGQIISTGPLITPVGTLASGTAPGGAISASQTPAGMLATEATPQGTIVRD